MVATYVASVYHFGQFSALAKFFGFPVPAALAVAFSKAQAPIAVVFFGLVATAWTDCGLEDVASDSVKAWSGSAKATLRGRPATKAAAAAPASPSRRRSVSKRSKAE